MADLDAVLEQLRQERKRAEGELRQLEKVIAQLSKVRTSSSLSGSGKGMKRQLSAAARERIAAAPIPTRSHQRPADWSGTILDPVRDECSCH